MSVPLKVLIAENVEDDALLMVEHLRRSGYATDWTRVQTALDFETMLTAEAWGVILSDYMMEGFTGLQAFQIYKRSGLDIPFLLVSGSIGEEKAVEAMRSGVHDYLLKDRLSRLGAAVERELREAVIRRLRRDADAEVRRLNAALRGQVRKLSHSNTRLEQFIFAASHEMQEPLRTVTSHTQLLLKQRPPSPDKEETESAESIREAVERMRDQINGLLAYSRAGDTQAAVTSPANPNKAAAEAVVFLTADIEANRAQVLIDLLPEVMIEPAPLLQIFHRLVSNALKYRRENEAPRIRISALEQGNDVQFSVSDNGIGIAPEHHQEIFLLFRRLHGAKYPGIGLGLALCKEIVERFDGRIWLESQPHAGSTFYFTLPKARAVATAIEETA